MVMFFDRLFLFFDDLIIVMQNWDLSTKAVNILRLIPRRHKMRRRSDFDLVIENSYYFWMVNGPIPELHKKYIKGTEKNAIIQLIQAFLCNLTVAVTAGIKSSCSKVYINTRVIKHAYDKRPAQEFDFLVLNVHLVVKYPDKVYKNKEGKRGEYCFVKEIKNQKYICILENNRNLKY